MELNVKVTLELGRSFAEMGESLLKGLLEDSFCHGGTGKPEAPKKARKTPEKAVTGPVGEVPAPAQEAPKPEAPPQVPAAPASPASPAPVAGADALASVKQKCLEGTVSVEEARSVIRPILQKYNNPEALQASLEDLGVKSQAALTPEQRSEWILGLLTQYPVDHAA